MQTTREIFQQLLRGKDLVAQQRLDAYLNSIPANPFILWYPSAGYDFRDLTEFSAGKAAENGVNVLPDIYIHTDVCKEIRGVEVGEIYNNERIRIFLTGKYELELNPQTKVKYEINRKYCWYADDLAPSPQIVLMEITRQNANEVMTSGVVLYFSFENNNFLDQVILQYKIPISHIVKIREGVAEGGVRMSIAYVLDMLSLLGTKYLVYGDSIASSIIDLDFLVLEEKLFQNYNLHPCAYFLIKRFQILNWSRYTAKIFEIQYQNEQASPGCFIRHISQLGY